MMENRKWRGMWCQWWVRKERRQFDMSSGKEFSLCLKWSTLISGLLRMIPWCLWRRKMWMSEGEQQYSHTKSSSRCDLFSFKKVFWWGPKSSRSSRSLLSGRGEFFWLMRGFIPTIEGSYSSASLQTQVLKGMLCLSGVPQLQEK